MPVTIKCPNPNCGNSLEIAKPQLGLAVRCHRCSQSFPVTPSDVFTRSNTPGAAGGDTEPASAPDYPARVGRFQIEARLGSGGFGTVYRAIDPTMRRQVGLKVPHPDALSGSEGAERFFREARAAGGLHHPNIVSIYETGGQVPNIYMVLAFIEGPTLAQMIAEKPLEPREAARIARRLAEALAYAHSRGVVHRDVKPSNVLVDNTGEPYLADFGLAHLQEASRQLTRDGKYVGTPAYIAPEVINGSERANLPVSDQYALGVLLYELLCGRVPFEGPPDVVMFHTCQTKPGLPSQHRPGVPRDLELICMKCLAKDPRQRYASTEDMAEDLGRLLDGKPVRARPVGRVKRAWHWCRRHPVVASLLAVVLFGAILSGVVLRLETADGTLVVEINDKEVEARIKDGKLILTGPDGKVRYTLTPGDRNKQLAAGPYKIRVEGAAGLVLDTSEFTLTKGGQVTVRVTLEPKAEVKKVPVAAKKDLPVMDADRTAAEYVLSRGGWVQVNDEPRQIRVVAELPKMPFRPTVVVLIESQQVNAAGFAAFKGCIHMLFLNLENTSADDACVSFLKDCKSLKDLNLAGTRVSDAGLAHFKGCTQLTTLKLWAMPNITDAGMAHFKECKKIESLNLGRTKVGDTGLANFEGCKDLTQLVLFGTQVTDAGLKQLAPFTKLAGLSLHDTGIKDEGLKALAPLTNLTTLGLYGTKVTGAGLKELAPFTKLTTLALGRSQVKDAGLKDRRTARS